MKPLCYDLAMFVVKSSSGARLICDGCRAVLELGDEDPGKGREAARARGWTRRERRGRCARDLCPACSKKP
jgi:hypothetical protein